MRFLLVALLCALSYAQTDALVICDSTQECKQDAMAGVAVHCTGSDSCEDARITLLLGGSRLYCHARKACATSRITCQESCTISCSSKDACKQAQLNCNDGQQCSVKCATASACEDLELQGENWIVLNENFDVQTLTCEDDDMCCAGSYFCTLRRHAAAKECLNQFGYLALPVRCEDINVATDEPFFTTGASTTEVMVEQEDSDSCVRSAPNCSASDYFSSCSAGQICSPYGCHDCPQGSHICPEGSYLHVCPNDQQCSPRGCDIPRNILQVVYLTDKEHCCHTDFPFEVLTVNSFGSCKDVELYPTFEAISAEGCKGTCFRMLHNGIESLYALFENDRNQCVCLDECFPTTGTFTVFQRCDTHGNSGDGGEIGHFIRLIHSAINDTNLELTIQYPSAFTLISIEIKWPTDLRLYLRHENWIEETFGCIRLLTTSIEVETLRFMNVQLASNVLNFDLDVRFIHSAIERGILVVHNDRFGVPLSIYYAPQPTVSIYPEMFEIEFDQISLEVHVAEVRITDPDVEAGFAKLCIRGVIQQHTGYVLLESTKMSLNFNDASEWYFEDELPLCQDWVSIRFKLQAIASSIVDDLTITVQLVYNCVAILQESYSSPLSDFTMHFENQRVFFELSAEAALPSNAFADLSINEHSFDTRFYSELESPSGEVRYTVDFNFTYGPDSHWYGTSLIELQQQGDPSRMRNGTRETIFVLYKTRKHICNYH